MEIVDFERAYIGQVDLKTAAFFRDKKPTKSLTSKCLFVLLFDDINVNKSRRGLNFTILIERRPHPLLDDANELAPAIFLQRSAAFPVLPRSETPGHVGDRFEGKKLAKSDRRFNLQTT
ncbi:hypothetical protein GEV33_003341 [Tenebrio molitor]|uniref:Uncharacterized protein n=1 Tax=Tenebrio molitor TaxID=7067 RepID=A0A8J6HRI2_TENMO|nr:hypothetical protein GEV33_003341 [Tenebrio molitor]